MSEIKSKNILEVLKEYWVIIGFFIGLVITWANNSSQISEMRIRLDKMEIQQQATALSIQAVRESQVRIETKFEYLIK